MTITWSGVIGFGSTGTYEFPDEDGVYVMAEITGKESEVRYVGQGNIYTQIELHKSSNEPNPCLKGVMSDTSNVKVQWAIIADQTDRDNAEFTYWKHYSNEEHNLCNKISPPGEYVAGIPLPF